MKKIKIIIAIAFVLSILSFSAYAQKPNVSSEPEAGFKQYATGEPNTEIIEDNEKQGKCGNCDKDPLKRLEDRKEDIQKEYKEGKITKEKADELTKKIDKHIEKVKEFNSLTLPQKKEHILAKLKSHVDQDIKDGKITKEEGDQIITNMTKELENWDGKGFPKLMGKGDKHKK